MSMIVHSSDANQIYIRENFTMHELRCRSTDRPDYFELSDTTLDLLQYVRSYTGQPIRVTSTLRTQYHQSLLNANGTTTTLVSQHTYGNAIDWQFIDSSYHNIFVTKLFNFLEEDLRDFGLGGLGIYDTFFHFDDRDSSAIWDNRTYTPPEQPDLPSDMNEDGISIHLLDKKKWVFLAFLGIAILKK